MKNIFFFQLTPQCYSLWKQTQIKNKLSTNQEMNDSRLKIMLLLSSQMMFWLTLISRMNYVLESRHFSHELDPTAK